MIYSFDKIAGPKPSQSNNFEELMAQLLECEFGARSVDEIRGDHRIDCQIEAPDGHLTVFQYKHLEGCLTPTR
jgi:hypothetical protein